MDYQIWLPVSAFLIKHPKGLVLVDTGWHTDVRIDQKKHLGWFHWCINKADLPPGEAIHEQLQQKGIKPNDLDFVVLSHLHSDHTSGLKLLGDAKKILVSEPEWRNANGKDKIRYVPSMWDGVTITTYQFSSSEFGPLGSAYDLFDDGAVVFVHTPGHTEGVVSTRVAANGKFVLLFADVGYGRKSWEQMIPPGTAVNEKQAMESLNWVRITSQEPGCIASLASHDSEVSPHTIDL